jgi:hypothetical protein
MISLITRFGDMVNTFELFGSPYKFGEKHFNSDFKCKLTNNNK